MKVFSMSQRIYYKDLEPDAELIIKKDLELYNCMLHKAFKICFDRAYKDVTYSETDQRMIKSFYGTSDYFPLSAIYEAKALVKSLKCREKEDRDLIKTRIKKIDKKRSSYYNFYTDKNWNAVDSYELALSSSMGFDKVVKLIIDYANAKFADEDDE